MVSSLNFALKSEEEQTAIIYAYQSFLNSLDFSCQIVIQSRKINIIYRSSSKVTAGLIQHSQLLLLLCH
jgi:hypothetical protein